MTVIVLCLVFPFLGLSLSVKDQQRHSLRNCPLSSKVVGPLSTGLFSYPLNVWDSKLLRSLNNDSTILFNCTSIEVNHQLYFDRFHTCSSVLTCPIHKQNLFQALKRGREWSIPHYFCNFKDALANSLHPVNIIVLGGSVTAGQFTDGYYCEPKFDRKCKASKNPREGKFSWGHYLKTWFESQGMTHVKVHLFATHGYSSSVMNEAIIDKLIKAGIPTLSESDLVLVDHSYNDGLYLTKIKVMPLQRGLEGLIRKLYEHGNPTSRPRIVLLETLAYLPHWLPFYQDYQEIYTKIAKYYQLPIWSIRDAVNSEYSGVKQAEYVKVMRHDESVRYDLHVGWHMHLFYADFVAALLRLSISESKCTGASRPAALTYNVTGPKKHSQPVIMSTKARAVAKNKADTSLPLLLPVLPTPLFDSINRSCDPKVLPLLDISAEKVVNGDPVIGSWARLPADPAVKAWDLRSEGRGRYGWIQEKSVAGASSSASSAEPAKLTFYPADPDHLLGRDGKEPHLIQVQYLRTYQNAGQVRVFICGHLIQGGDGMVRGNMDALWHSYDNYRLSLPEIEYIVFPDFGFHCKNPDDMGIRFECVNDIQCRDGGQEECRREKEARTAKQKFKIISVKVCALSRA